MSVTIHPCVPCPKALLPEEDGADVEFPAFKRVLQDPSTTVPELYAVLRLWEPVVQEHIGAVVYEILKRKGGVNDRDSVTDMSLLHFACKAGAAGNPKPEVAAAVASDLLKRGADVDALCRWTKMTALHYSAFFNSAEVLKVLLTEAKPDINLSCQGFEGASALHLAALAGAAESVAILLEHNADPMMGDNNQRTPLDCAEQVSRLTNEDGPPSEMWKFIIDQLSAVTPQGASPKKPQAPPPSPNPPMPGVKTEASIQVGSRVIVNDTHHGVVRFKGPLQFKSGEVVGVQLDTDNGDNNGTNGGVEYFRCKPRHGIFVKEKACKLEPEGSRPAPASTRKVTTPSRSNISRNTTPSRTSSSRTSATPKATSSFSRPTSASTSRSSARIPRSTPAKRSEAPLSARKSGASVPHDAFGVGSKVFLNGNMCTVKYVGPIEVAKGTFIGVHLDTPTGKNDGSLNGKRYFNTQPNHGLFVDPKKCSWRGIKVSDVLGNR
eukprot:m.32736 g.32736  ORF g.32736 m.32736 type:complete len:493 (+) comp8445_c0_seq2:606-2084(+)